MTYLNNINVFTYIMTRALKDLAFSEYLLFMISCFISSSFPFCVDYTEHEIFLFGQSASQKNGVIGNLNQSFKYM